MTYSLADLALARRHVAEAEVRIARQRALIGELEARGESTYMARDLLDAFQDTEHEMLVHLRLIEDSLKR